MSGFTNFIQTGDGNASSPANTVIISPSGGDYTTIQGALTANAVDGTLFIVYPGTYTNDTINLTANNQCIKGNACSPKSILVTNTAQICDFGATTGGVLENMKMVMTVPANSIDVTITGTGSLNVKFCHAEAVLSGTNSASGGGSVYGGSGTVKVIEGSIVLTDTSDRTTSKGKKAVNVEAGSSWVIDDVIFTVTGSGTSSSISAVRSTSTGTILLDKCNIDVDDDDSLETAAFSVINGNGDTEAKYNNIHVVNNGSGHIAVGGSFDSDGSSLSFRSSFNHVHVESASGTANYVIIKDSQTTVIAQFNDVIAVDGTDNTNGGTFTLVSSEEDGKITASGGITGDVTGNADTVTGFTPASGSLILSGADALTVTTTAATGITLPTTGTLSAIAGTETLTNKTITPRVLTFTTDATPEVDSDDYDAVTITALAAAITDVDMVGSAELNFQKLTFRIKDNGTARAIAWGSDFEDAGAVLPTTTVISKLLTVGFIYNTVTAKWGCVAAANET